MENLVSTCRYRICTEGMGKGKQLVSSRSGVGALFGYTVH